MKRLLFVIFVLVLSFNFAFAQQQVARSYTGPTQNPKTVKKSAAKANQATNTKSKGEVYVGYSGTAAPTTAGGGFSGSRKVHHGIQTSVTFNATRYVGLKGDFSIGYDDRNVRVTQGGTTSNLTRRTTITNILGGVQFKDNESEAVVQPFAHALIGVANYRQRFREQNCNNSTVGVCGSLVKGWGLAGAFGGGFDLKIANRAGVRLVGDYNPMRIKSETINNFRFGVGVVFK